MQQLEVLRLLRDGKRHSGEALARNLGLTRAAVWKHVSKLERWGLEVESVRGHGYRLSRPVDLLDQELISAGLSEPVARRVESLEVFAELDSTNHHLLHKPPPGAGQLAACLAEYQRAGRGRRGRRWSAPFGGGLCLSIGWLFAEIPRDVAALSLAVAVAARHAIRDLTGRAPTLKWPNDLVWDDRKLGGILVEFSAECQGACHVVIGIGVNVSMEARRLRAASDWPNGAADLHMMTGGSPPSRNELAARLIGSLYRLLSAYEVGGFEDHHAEFVAASYLQDRTVIVMDGEHSVSGQAIAVDPDGALVLRTETGIRRVISGEVSVRPA